MKTILFLALMTVSISAFATQYVTDYESVAASQSNQVLGPVGAAGDIIDGLVVSVNTAATSAVHLKDGGLSTVPASMIVPNNTPVGTYGIHIGARSVNGGWRVTTGAGVSVIGVGSFR